MLRSLRRFSGQARPVGLPLYSVVSRLSRCPDIAGRPTGRRDVALLRVIHNHSVRIKPPAQGSDGPLHALDPSARKAVTVALIIERDDLVAQHPKEILAIAPVMHLRAGMDAAVADGESVQAIVSLGPPAIEDR